MYLPKVIILMEIGQRSDRIFAQFW